MALHTFLLRSILVAGSLSLAIACSKSKTSSVTKENAAPVGSTDGPAKPGGDYETLWCRGGGRSSAATDVELLTFSARSKGIYIETNFEFDASPKAAGNAGRALEPGTCAYPDRPYGPGTVKLQYGETERGHIRWRTSATGTSALTASVPADGISSDKWLMKAQVTKAQAIGSYQTFKL
jgi:hypothetical protein